MQLTDKEKKYGLVALGVLTLGTIGYFVFRTAPSGNTGASADPTGNGTVTNPGGTYTFDATKTANELYDAMKPTGFAGWTGLNPNERAKVFAALERVNSTQFGQVVQKFGRRSYNKTAGNQINYFPITPLPLEPLAVWLKNELDFEDYSLLKLKYPNHL